MDQKWKAIKAILRNCIKFQFSLCICFGASKNNYFKKYQSTNSPQHKKPSTYTQPTPVKLALREKNVFSVLLSRCMSEQKAYWLALVMSLLSSIAHAAPTESIGMTMTSISVISILILIIILILVYLYLRINYPWNDCPVLLLPVRLETRFKGNDLLVRIYPDQILVDTHETRLTQAELNAGQDYLAKCETNGDEGKQNAWRALARSFGPQRAAWIKQRLSEVEDTSNVRIKDEAKEGWLVVPKLQCLPDLFVVYAYRGEKLFKRVPGNKLEGDYTLLAKPSDTQTELFDADSKWLADFDNAEVRGMAVRIDVSGLSNKEKHFSKIIAVGLRTTGAREGKERVQQLIESHHYSSGLGFIKRGTPTNNTQKVKSGHSETKEDYEASYDYEVEGYSNWDTPADEPASNAERMGWALGLEENSPIFCQKKRSPPRYRPEVFRHIAGAEDEVNTDVKEMHTALWTATGDYLLQYLLPGIVTKDDRGLLAEHFIEFVRGRGVLPAIRVGDQPYGILPVSSVRDVLEHRYGWQASQKDNNQQLARLIFDVRFHRILVKLHDKWWLKWAENTDRVPRVNADSTNPDETLLQLLSMQPTSMSYRKRLYVDERFVSWLLVALRDHSFGEGAPYKDIVDSPEYWVQKWAEVWWGVRAEQAANWSDITQVSSDKLKDVPLMRLLAWWNDQSVDISNLIGDDVYEYLEKLANEEDHDSQAELYKLLKFSLEHANNTYITKEKLDVAINDLGDQSKTSADGIEQVFRETLDLCTHRLDAWISSLATKRLTAMRETRPDGVYVGAYGFVEDLEFSEQPQSAGFIHAPSLAQAQAAAVLHNAYLTHQNGNDSNPFHINLNSARVRIAKELIEGVRQGQPLGALLGYQFERFLHEFHSVEVSYLDQYIDNFRETFPLVANKVTEPESTVPTQDIAARNVVDGLALAQWWREIKPSDQHERLEKDVLSPSVDTNIKNALVIELNRVLSNLNAVSDILMYEGVYHTVQGNYERGGAALDAVSGNTVPPELESINTPASGKSLTHRVCVLFSADDPENIDDSEHEEEPNNNVTPRALAEPCLANWLNTIFSDLSKIKFRFDFKSPRININEAPPSELAYLPNIDLSIAEKIETYREQYGPFTQVDQLVNVDNNISEIVVDCLRRWVMTGYEQTDKEKFYTRINISTATKEELINIPGITETQAETIEENQPFFRIGDLNNLIEIDLDTIRHFITTGEDTISLQDLSVTPERSITGIDLLYMSAFPPEGEETEIEQRIAYWVREEFGLKYDDQIEMDFSRTSEGTYGLRETMGLARQVLNMLGNASILRPASLALPAEGDAAVFTERDCNNLLDRINSALNNVCVCKELLTNGSGNDLINELHKAALYGVYGVIPAAPNAPDLEERRNNAVKELEKRHGQAETLTTEANNLMSEIYGQAETNSQRSSIIERAIHKLIEAMQSLLGREFIVLPTFSPNNVDELKNAFNQTTLLNGLGKQRVNLWLQQAAQVHTPLCDLEDMLMMSEAWMTQDLQDGTVLNNEPRLSLKVAQLPYDSNNKWLALDDEERGDSINDNNEKNRGAVSLVAAVHNPQGLFESTQENEPPEIAGLLLHQWDELIPSNTVDTNISFQYNAPNSQPPQSLLLAVPSQRGRYLKIWTVDELATIVEDTMDLAKVRAVDLDAMSEKEEDSEKEEGVGLVLPALMFPKDPGQPGWDREGTYQFIEDWLAELLPDVCGGFRREMDEDILPISRPSIETNSIIFTNLNRTSLILKGKYLKGNYPTIPYSAFFPVVNKLHVELPTETLKVSLYVAWKDQAIVDVEDVENLHIANESTDKNGNAIPVIRTIERVEDTRLRINVDHTTYPLFAIHLKGAGIKSIKFGLGAKVLIDKLCYKSISNLGA